MDNVALLTDSYKLGHYGMYPPETEGVYSYFESRAGATFSYTVFFGLQYILKKYLEGTRVMSRDIVGGREFCQEHFGMDGVFNTGMWEHISRNHGGRLPVLIKAVPEGLPVTTGNVLMTIENTDPRCYPLTNHLETVLSQVWYPSTVATLSKKVRSMLAKFAEKTVDVPNIDFGLHDFGFRGASSVESAGIGGMAHLINFRGTDTVEGILYANQYYNSGVCGYSVYATEHSIMTAFGREGEPALVGRLLDQYPKGILSIVGDSYNIFSFCSDILGKQYHDKVLNRDGVTVVRPDSGDPVTTCLRCLELLGTAFGTKRSLKGYLVINPKVRLLWGDGLDYDKIYDILLAATDKGWSSENFSTFGMGGGLLQKVNRDTQRFAFKSSAQKRYGKWNDIYKDPLDSTKLSKKGRLALTFRDGQYKTIPEDQVLPGEDMLKPVFRDGKILKEWTFDEVRKNAAII